MSAESWLAAGLSMVIVAYLIYTLLRPERF
jgi:K+-transporting ATPase KdpF subunit